MASTTTTQHLGTRRILCIVRIFLILLVMTLPALATDWRVKEVQFSGNRAYTAAQLRNVMETKPNHFWSKSLFSPSKLDADLFALQTLYGQKGFLAAEITIAALARDTARTRVTILLNVNEGPQTMVDSIAITGKSVLNVSEEMPRIKTKPDAPFNRADIDRDAQILVGDLGAKGYLYSHADDSTVIDTVAHRAKVTYRLYQGPLIFAGSLGIAGLKKVRSYVVKRELTFRPGDTLTSKKIDLSVQKLYTTGLFNYVQIQVPPEILTLAEHYQDSLAEPVTITVEEAHFFSVDAAIGYGTYDRVRASLETRYANLYGRGDAITFNGNYDRFQMRGAVTYTYPWIAAIPLTANISTYIEHHDITYRGLFEGIQFAVAHETELYFSYRLSAKLERAANVEALQDTNTQSIGADLFYDTRKKPADSAKGGFFQFSPELAGLGGSGTNQYYRFLLDMRGHIMPTRRLLLSSAIDIGYAKGYGANGAGVPPQVLYNIGIEGIRPVRGYTENKLSPGGGRLAVVINLLEARRQVYKWIGALAFCDGGFAWADGTAKWGDIRWVAGPGIYVKTPVGQAELDFGYRLNGTRGWGSAYFSIGQSF